MIDTPSRERAEAAIAGALVQRMQRSPWRRFGAYAAATSEASLWPWFDLIGTDVELSLPCIDSAGVMRFRRWVADERLVIGPFGIEQPSAAAQEVTVAALDVLLMPLLGFDRSGVRLGSGAGYYDRALAHRGPRVNSPLLVGIAFATQEFECLPRDSWDVPLDAVVTENGWLDIPPA